MTTDEAMNFRDYASAIRTQATAVARNIPNLNDMAAKDEYIHSEEFNVRGQQRAKPESSLTLTTTVTAPSAVVADPDETSSMGSWSLLDRSPSHLRFTGAGAGALVKDKMETFSIQDSATMSANTSVSSEGPSATKQRRLSQSSSSIPLFSVVANVLDEDNADVDADPGDGDGLDSSGESNSSQSDDASVDSELEDDENDPIMSILRQSKKAPAKERQHQAPKAKRKKSVENNTDTPRAGGKSSQRFLQDLPDEPASASAIGDERMEAGLQLSAVPTLSSETTTTTTTVFGMKAPFGGLLINAAKTQFDRILHRPESSLGDAETYSSKVAVQAPPLARERPQTAKTHSSDAADFQRAASTSFMGDEEMAELARLKGDTKLGRCSVLVGLIQEYQSFCFIIFTLILAVFVFFFHRSPDDVS